MNVLVIGAAGFVGGHLIEYLHTNYEYKISATKLPHETIAASCEVVDLDIRDSGQVKTVLEDLRPQWIFHLAAQSSAAVAWSNPQLTVDVNIKGAVNVLEAVRSLDYKPRLLIVGSGEEYGAACPDEPPINEACLLNPENIYAATKAAQSMLANVYFKAYNMDLLLVRSFNQTGPGQLPKFVIADFCKQVAEIELEIKEPTIFVGNIKVKRDFTDVRDAVRAYCLLMERGESGEVYNLGSGRAVGLDEILTMVTAQSKKKIAIVVDKNKIRPTDVPIIEANICKISKLGYATQYNLSDTLKDVLEYWRKTLVGNN